MDSRNLVLATAIGLLRVSDHKFVGAIERVRAFPLFNRDESTAGLPIQIGRVGAKERLPFEGWLETIRHEHILDIRVGLPREGATSHRLAGFAGSRPWVLDLTTKFRHEQYVVGTISSSRQEMNRQQVVELLNVQRHPEFFWNVAHQEVLQFQLCNDEEPVERADIQAFFSSGRADKVWKFLAEQLVQELQVEALTFDESFVIPAHLDHLFVRVEPVFDEPPFEPIVGQLQVLDEEGISGPELVRLVNAQGLGSTLWDRCADVEQLEEDLGDDFNLDEFPSVSSEEWPSYLASLTSAEVENVRDEIVELISREYESLGRDPIVPEDLQDRFGIDEIEKQRCNYRLRLQHDLGWQLAGNENPWHFYVLDQTEQLIELTSLGDGAIEQGNFDATLEEIEAFAKKVGSSFAISFRLARFLSHQQDPIERGSILQVADFAAINDEYIDYHMSIVELLRGFGWSAHKINGLAALSVADVFGAMGSWNDQDFEGADQLEFERLSARLYAANSRYLSSLLASEN